MICAVVLAAGRSERMGTQKLLLPLGGKPVVVRIVDELLGSRVERILVVVGRDSEQLCEALNGRAVQFIENPDPASDMLGSVRCGLRNLPAKSEAALIVIGDQPGISSELVDEMIHCFREGKGKIVVPVCERRRGHPVLFSTQFRDDVLSHYGNDGLRGFIDAHSAEVHGLAVSPAAILEDMDTPADYRRLEEWFASQLRRNGFTTVANQIQHPLSSGIP